MSARPACRPAPTSISRSASAEPRSIPGPRSAEPHQVAITRAGPPEPSSHGITPTNAVAPFAGIRPIDVPGFVAAGTGALVFTDPAGKTERVEFKGGTVGFRDAKATHQVGNPGTAPMRVIEVELKR